MIFSPKYPLQRFLIVVIAAGFALLGARSAAAQDECGYDPSEKLNTKASNLISLQDPYLGNPGSDVVVVEFFDPNCSHCQEFHSTMKELVDRYEDEVLFYMKPYPLWGYSIPQLVALRLAARQSKFYEMVDKQFARQERGGLSNNELVELAGEIGMDEDKFARQLQSEALRQEVLQQKERLKQAGVSSTPTLAIGKRVFSRQSRYFACLSRLIEEELQADS